MEPNWKPLEMRLGSKRCASFMFMGRINGINLYKHGIARMYLNFDDAGECYVLGENGRYERASFAAGLSKLESALHELGETMESVYDDSYTSKKREALQRAGIAFQLIEIQPDHLSICSLLVPRTVPKALTQEFFEAADSRKRSESALLGESDGRNCSGSTWARSNSTMD